MSNSNKHCILDQNIILACWQIKSQRHHVCLELTWWFDPGPEIHTSYALCAHQARKMQQSLIQKHEEDKAVEAEVEASEIMKRLLICYGISLKFHGFCKWLFHKSQKVFLLLEFRISHNVASKFQDFLLWALWPPPANQTNCQGHDTVCIGWPTRTGIVWHHLI